MPMATIGSSWRRIAIPGIGSEWRIPRFSPRGGRRNSIPPYVRAAAEPVGVFDSPDRPTGGL